MKWLLLTWLVIGAVWCVGMMRLSKRLERRERRMDKLIADLRAEERE